MKILFAGTPEMAVPSLRRVHERYGVAGVLTAIDAPSGRKRKPVAPPVKVHALELGLPVLQPERLDGPVRDAIATLGVDLLVCVAYGKIFGPKFLSLFAGGAINLHPSLLPRHRGPSPIPAAILAGDDETGISVQRIAREMDAGDILKQSRFKLNGTETTGGLTERVAQEGAELLVEALRQFELGIGNSLPQDETLVTYCHRISAADGAIDWASPADVIDRAVRAYNPWPGAFTLLGKTRLTIHEAVPVEDSGVGVREIPTADGQHEGTVVAVDKKSGILVQTGSGLLAIRRLQLQSRNPLDWKSFANGHRDLVGTVLGGSPHL